MLVKDWMRDRVVSIEADKTIKDAVELLRTHEIRMLPVLKKGSLVGILTDRDIKRASVPDFLSADFHDVVLKISETKVEEIMNKEPISVPPNYTVEETAELLLEHKISGVPVVDTAGKIVGVITQSDLFSVLMSVTGMGKRGIQYAFMQKRGIQFAMLVKDRPGCIKELEEILRKYGGRMTSVLSTYGDVPDESRKVYIRMYGIDRSKLPQIKEALKEKATLLYMVDHRNNIREIY